MACGPMTHGKYMGKKMETVADFIFLGSKITVDGNYSYEIKSCLLFGRKAMTNLDSVLKIKGRGVTFPTNDLYNQSYGFPSSHICKSWSIKKA